MAKSFVRPKKQPATPQAAKAQLKRAGILAQSPQAAARAQPVLADKAGGQKGVRLLTPTTFDEASYTVTVPMITAQNMRAYIERQARPLEKLIRIANGDMVNGIQPDWDDMKEAIYKLVDKVAPDLKSVEVTHDVDPEAGAGESSQVVSKLVQALTDLALAKRGDQALTITSGTVPGES